MLISGNCVAFVKEFEGFSATPYYDSVGVKTIGYGMTGTAINNLTYVTEQQASDMLKNLLNYSYATPIVNDLSTKKVNLNQNQIDALTSMAYNIGTGGLLGSTLYKNIVAGVRDKSILTSNFQMWCNAGGKRLEGLFRRRTAEAEMFFRNDNSVKEVEKLDTLIVYSNDTDKEYAETLSKAIKAPTLHGDIPYHYDRLKQVICIGAPGKLPFTSYCTKLLQGKDREETKNLVNAFIANGGK